VKRSLPFRFAVANIQKLFISQNKNYFLLNIFFTTRIKLTDI